MQVTMRTLAATMTFVMIFRLFKVWEGIPAMRSVARAVQIAISRLTSFGVILVCLVVLFAGAGMLAFGQQMTEFHTFMDAIVSTLIVVTTGEADIYNKQFLISPGLASVWHWLLICVMWVVCLNLILCILVDAYAEAQAGVAEAEASIPSLLDQAKDAGNHFIGEQVRPRLGHAAKLVAITLKLNPEGKHAEVHASKCASPSGLSNGAREPGEAYRHVQDAATGATVNDGKAQQGAWEIENAERGGRFEAAGMRMLDPTPQRTARQTLATSTNGTFGLSSRDSDKGPGTDG